MILNVLHPEMYEVKFHGPCLSSSHSVYFSKFANFSALPWHFEIVPKHGSDLSFMTSLGLEEISPGQ